MNYGNNQRIYNNVIHATSTGINVGSSIAADTVYIAHNTVYIPVTTNETYCLRKNSSNGRFGLYNNIFINKSTSSDSRCYRSEGNSILPSSNNNIYYCERGAVFSNSSDIKYTVNEYIELFGDSSENNSHQVEVPFISTVSPFNFNIRTDVPTKAESGGQPLSWILTDIDGIERDSLTPDIGAYEFDGIKDNTDLSPLHGIYTIDNVRPTNGRNFNTFQEAISTLNARSVSDTTIFETVPGQVHDILLTDYRGLRIVSGGAIDKPVVFRKSDVDAGNTVLSVSGTSNNSDACFYLENVNYITFDGLDIENAGTASSSYLERGFYLNNISNVQLRNCNIQLRNASNNYGIYISGTTEAFQTDNVTIKDASYGYYFYTNSASNMGNIISKSYIDGVDTGIYVYNYSSSYRQNGFTIKESKIYNAGTGIYLNYGNNQRIFNNVICATSTGIYLNSSNTTDTTYLAHNTVYIPTTTSSAAYCLRKSSSNGRLSLCNNIFINKSSNNSSYCFYNENNTIILPESNNNIYYKDNGYLYRSSSASASTLDAYRTLLNDSRESNSVEEDVPFISAVNPFDFDVQTNIPTKAESGGKQLSWITADIDGNLRYGAPYYGGSGSASDIGAYEFEGKGMFAQSVCSGDSTGLVDFPILYQGVNVTWQITKQPNHTTGYLETGSGILPEMELINTSGQPDTLVYTVTSDEGVSLNYTITVRPQLQIGNFSDNMFPVDNTIVQNLSVTFSWQSVMGASFYDFYLWNETDQCPAQPTKANLQAIQYTHSSNFAYGNKYRWKIVAKSLCTQAESDVRSFELRRLPDLHVTQVNISAAYAGQTATVTWTVKNDGQGTTVEPLWYDRVWLISIAADGSNSTTSHLLATVPNVQGLNIGESYNNSVEVDIPERMTGTYYLFVSTDMSSMSSIDWTPTGSPVPPVPYTPDISGVPYPYLFAYGGSKMEAEVSDRYGKYDNFFYNQFEIYPSPVPDLTVASTSFPNSIFSGQTMNLTYEVKNQGTVSAQGSWVDAVYISPDPELNENARFLKNINRNNELLKADSSYTTTQTLQIPNYIMGDYYVFVVTNATDAIYESVYKENNTYRSTAMLTIFLTPPPDLAPVNLTVPAVASVKEQCTISYTVSNIGANPTPESYWRDRIYLSPSSTFNLQTAILVADYAHYGVLTVDSSYVVQQKITIPDNISGTWYFFVYADGKDNNVLACAHATGIVCPNLELAGMQIHTNPLVAGENTSISWKIKNTGTGNVNNITITDNLYISTSTTYNPNQSTLLNTLDYPLTLAAGDSITQTVNVKLPCLSAGNYYIYAVTDVNQKVFELGNTGNNRLRTDLQSLLSPDLIITDLTVPAEGSSGQAITIDYTLKNDHNGIVSNKAVKIKFYASPQVTFNATTAIAIGEHDVVLDLNPAATLALQTVCNLPDGINGNYYLYAKVNAGDAVCENNTNNNVKQSEAIAVTLSPWADFVVTRVEKPDTCIAGNPVAMQYEVKNTGTAAISNGTWNDKIYLSRKMFLDNTATLLHTVNKRGNLDVGETYIENLNVMIPASSTTGEYYLLVFTDADDYYYEHLSEENNVLVSGKTVIDEYPLDLAAIALQAPEVTPWGGTISVELQAKNISDKNTLTDTWFDGFYLSTDSSFTASSIFLKEQKHIGHLLPDGTYTVTASCVIPNGLDGNYYLIAVIDHKTANHDISRANNFIGKKITVSAVPSPDLIIENFAVLDAPVSGQPFPVTYTIKNAGTGNIVNASWNDYIIFSSNPNAPLASDAMLNNQLRRMSLMSGESYCDVTVPLPKEGNFILWLKANALNAVYEHNGRNNNQASASVAVHLPLPGDLQPYNIQAEAEIISGNYLHISYDIRNNANTPMTGNNLKDLVYLSQDTLFDINSKLLGQVTGSVNLPAYGSVSRNLTARVSGIKEGDYFLIVKTDVLNAFNETDKANNTAASVYPVRVRLKSLPVNTPLSDNLLNNLGNDYKLETDTILGETVLVHLHSADSLQGAANNLYIKLNDMADNINYDISSDGQFTANPQVYIPSTLSSYYGVNVSGRTPVADNQDMILQADILPFEIRSISPDNGGNTGQVTVELLGAKFTPQMEVWLEKDSIVIDADTLIFVDFHKVYAVFDLKGQDIGKYALGAFNFCEGENYVENGFEIVDGAKDKLSTSLILPNSSRPNRVIAITLEYANLGTTDILHPVVDIYSHANSPISLSPTSLLEDDKLVLPVTLEIEGEPQGVLRPGTYGSVTFYAYTRGGLIFTIKKRP